MLDEHEQQQMAWAIERGIQVGLAGSPARRRERIATAVLASLAPDPDTTIAKHVGLAVAYADALIAALDKTAK
jgi:hypothetical protein